MLLEIGVPDEVSKIIFEKSFGQAVRTSQFGSWEVKILLYADNRVLPAGIGTLEERLKDVRERYAKYRNRPDLPDIENACRNIEKQIGKNMDIPVSEITDENLTASTDDLTTLHISSNN